MQGVSGSVILGRGLTHSPNSSRLNTNISLIFPACLEGKLQGFNQYPLEVWSGVFVLGFFGTALGFTWFYEGIDKIGPARSGIFINFVPVFATLLAVLILHEKMSSSLIFGAVFVICGVYLTNYQTKKTGTDKYKYQEAGIMAAEKN